MPPSPSCPPARDREPAAAASTRPAEPRSGSAFEPLWLSPLAGRRPSPWLVVHVDGSATSDRALVWALREAARREATVLAVAVPEDGATGHSPGEGPSRARALRLVDAQVLRAIAETGVEGRTRTAVLEPAVLEAVAAAGAGADLVLVGPTGKTLLRPAVPRPPFRRPTSGR